jgi:hypothetical protein
MAMLMDGSRLDGLAPVRMARAPAIGAKRVAIDAAISWFMLVGKQWHCGIRPRLNVARTSADVAPALSGVPALARATLPQWNCR